MEQYTKLEAFLRKYSIRPADLARESGYSRQHLYRLRTGKMEPTRPCIAAVVVACRRLSHRRVTAPTLFALGERK
jgi:predicted transcriptional regulator